MKKLLLILVLAIVNSQLSLKSALADGSAGSVCTPVYGMANSCAEHIAVDTGLETGALVNAGVLSYLLGLAAFIKSKRV